MQAAARDAELVNLPCSYVSTSVIGGLGLGEDEGDGAVSSVARVQHSVARSFQTGGRVTDSVFSSRCDRVVQQVPSTT